MARVTPTAPPQSPSHGSVRDHSLSLSPPRNILHSRMSLPPLQGCSPNVCAACLLTRVPESWYHWYRHSRTNHISHGRTHNRQTNRQMESLSVCPSVCLSVCPSYTLSLITPKVFNLEAPNLVSNFILGDHP